MNKIELAITTMLLCVVCFWAGRLTLKPEVVKEYVKVETYTPPTYLKAVCATLYPCPDSKKAGQ